MWRRSRSSTRGAASAGGPLLVVAGRRGCRVRRAGLGSAPSGEIRTGLVLEVHQDVAVVEVLEGTAGIDPDTVTVAFEGQPFEIPVGEGWLGRVWNGMGEPLDGGPPMLGSHTQPVAGWPINPIARDVPRDPIVTGDLGHRRPDHAGARPEAAGLLVGRACPTSSSPRRSPPRRTSTGEPFKVVVVGDGPDARRRGDMRDALEARSSGRRPGAVPRTRPTTRSSQRILAPRVALTVAEHLAFELGHHVLVVLADMTSYCEAVREVSAARGEIPGRRAYPGYLYSDLASLYERCGRIHGAAGSLTQVPVLTMPAGDITHPVPDLTGYITEGQIVLSPEVHGRGVYPPVDVLGSLSRLMRKGAGEGRTRADHPRHRRTAGGGPGPRARGPGPRRADRRGRADRHRPRLSALRGRLLRDLVSQRADERRDPSTTPCRGRGGSSPDCRVGSSRCSRRPTLRRATSTARSLAGDDDA